MSAVILLQEMMLRKKLDPVGAAEDDDDDGLPMPLNANNKDKVAVLAIAYHNMGVEQEFLRSYPAAILSYKKAVNFAEKHLGAEDGITLNLRSVYENAKNELDMALFKKGKKGTGKVGAGKKKKANMSGQEQPMTDEHYNGMITPRDQANMERVDEDQEEDVAGQDINNQ